MQHVFLKALCRRRAHRSTVAQKCAGPNMVGTRFEPDPSMVPSGIATKVVCAIANGLRSHKTMLVPLRPFPSSHGVTHHLVHIFHALPMYIYIYNIDSAIYVLFICLCIHLFMYLCPKAHAHTVDLPEQAQLD